jgi:hypothetical protein
MAAKVISPWPQLFLLKGTRFVATDKGRHIAIMLTVDRSLMSTEIVGRAETPNSLGAIVVIALVRPVMPVVVLSMTY